MSYRATKAWTRVERASAASRRTCLRCAHCSPLNARCSLLAPHWGSGTPVQAPRQGSTRRLLCCQDLPPVVTTRKQQCLCLHCLPSGCSVVPATPSHDTVLVTCANGLSLNSTPAALALGRRQVQPLRAFAFAARAGVGRAWSFTRSMRAFRSSVIRVL